MCLLFTTQQVSLARTSVTLAWDQSPGSGVAGYNLYYGVASQTYTNVIPCGNVTAATVTNLAGGTTYYFAVTSVDAAGLESMPSGEISAAIAGGTYDGVNLDNPSQASADPDGDGRSSLMEYALGTNPFNSSDAQAGLGTAVTQASGRSYVVMQFKRRKDLVGLQYIPEVSIDSQNWVSDTGHVQQVSVTPVDSQFDWVSAQNLTPISAAAPQFIRLKVVYSGSVTTTEALLGSGTTLSGNSGSGPKNTFFSQRLVGPLAYAGTISQLGAATLTDNNAAWTNGQFNATFYAQFTNGWMVDITNTDPSTRTLKLADDVRGLTVAGAPYVIRKHFTIQTLFGTTNQAGLRAGLNLSTADNILLTVPETQQMITVFYYNDGAGTHGWFRADFSPAADQVVYPEQGLIVQRRSAGDLLLALAGPVKTGQTIVPISVGYNLLGTLQAVTNLTLPQLSLYTGNPSTGIASGLNLSAADNLLIVQPSGAVATYFYYQDSAGTQGWFDAAFQSAQSVPVPAGSAFFLLRKTSHPAFNWLMP